MNLCIAAVYMNAGYRVRRASWEAGEYLTECAGMMEKQIWVEYGHFNSETRKFEDVRHLSTEHINPIDLKDLLADDWEVITDGIRKDFNKYGNLEYNDEPDWDNYEPKGWGEDD